MSKLQVGLGQPCERVSGQILHPDGAAAAADVTHYHRQTALVDEPESEKMLLDSPFNEIEATLSGGRTELDRRTEAPGSCRVVLAGYVLRPENEVEQYCHGCNRCSAQGEQ